MTEQYPRRPAESPTVECRCPEGWPLLHVAFVAGQPVRTLRHHPGDCGLPPVRDGAR